MLAVGAGDGCTLPVAVRRAGPCDPWRHRRSPVAGGSPLRLAGNWVVPQRAQARGDGSRRISSATRAVEMAHEDVPLVVIQHQLGHAILSISWIYLQGSVARRSFAPSSSRPAPVIPATPGLGSMHQQTREGRRSRHPSALAQPILVLRRDARVGSADTACEAGPQSALRKGAWSGCRSRSGVSGLLPAS